MKVIYGPDTGLPFPLGSDTPSDPNVDSNGVGRDLMGYLDIDLGSASFDFLWIANDYDGTTSKLNSKTLREVARYPTAGCFSLPGGSEDACDGTNGCCSADDCPSYL